jgi:transcriptional regulator with XRE-family HTH domain
LDCAILRGYRRACALTQQQLADMVGYDRSYISMIESGRRDLTGRGTLAHIARTLVIPPHVLGIAGQRRLRRDARVRYLGHPAGPDRPAKRPGR